MGHEKTPSETTLPGAVSEGAKSEKEGKGHNARIQKYSQAKANAEQIKLHIYNNITNYTTKDQARLKKAYNKLDTCGLYLLFHQYFTIGETRLVKASFCKQHLICHLCAIRRASKALQKYMEVYTYLLEKHKEEERTLRTSMLTLTVKNGEDLLERFEHLQKGVSKISQRIRDFRSKGKGSSEFTKIKGYVGSYEVTNKGNGWHPHPHILIVHEDEIDSKKMSREWKEVTGDSWVLSVDPCRNPDNPAKDFAEVFKYALKFASMSQDHVIEAFLKLHGKRLLFSGGLFRGVQLPEDLHDEPLEGLPYLELFYRYLPKAGAYSVERVRSFLENSSGKIAAEPVVLFDQAFHDRKVRSSTKSEKVLHPSSAGSPLSGAYSGAPGPVSSVQDGEAEASGTAPRDNCACKALMAAKARAAPSTQ